MHRDVDKILDEIIEKKKNKEELTDEEIKFWIDGVTDESIPDYQTSIW